MNNQIVKNWEEIFLEYADHMAKEYGEKARTDTDMRGAWFSRGVASAYEALKVEFYCAKHGIELVQPETIASEKALE